MRQEVIQKAPEQAKKQKPNLTGIPTQMKLDFEHRSGLSFDDVRVHYNSDKPRKIGALAYTQIPQVHIGPGQERHLRHELGHVVQQKQGIVRPTTWINGLPVNDLPELEQLASAEPTMQRPIEQNDSYVIQMIKIENIPWKIIERITGCNDFGLFVRFISYMQKNGLSEGDEDEEITKRKIVLLYQDYLREQNNTPAQILKNQIISLEGRFPAVTPGYSPAVKAPDAPHNDGTTNQDIQLPGGEHMLQLGFSSLALLQRDRSDSAGYKAKLIMILPKVPIGNLSASAAQFIYDEENHAPAFHNVEFSNVFTRAVTSCQFIVASDANKDHILIAHLNSRDYIPFDTLRTLYPDLQFSSAFVSSLDELDEKIKFAELERQFGVPQFGGRIIPSTKYLNRGANAHYHINQHEWIGIDLARHRITGTQGAHGETLRNLFRYELSTGCGQLLVEMQNRWGIELNFPSSLFFVAKAKILEHSKNEKDVLKIVSLQQLNDAFNSLDQAAKTQVIDVLSDSISVMYTYNLASRRIDL